MNHFYVNTYMLETSLVHPHKAGERKSFIVSGSLLGILCAKDGRLYMFVCFHEATMDDIDYNPNSKLFITWAILCLPPKK
jgi:hypothetical protein